MKDGGPAFPIVCEEVVQGPGGPYGVPATHYGMTLRDWFAGMALNGFALRIRDGGWPNDAGDPELAWVARTSYAIADAMLAEREGEVA